MKRQRARKDEKLVNEASQATRRQSSEIMNSGAFRSFQKLKQKLFVHSSRDASSISHDKKKIWLDNDFSLINQTSARLIAQGFYAESKKLHDPWQIISTWRQFFTITLLSHTPHHCQLSVIGWQIEDFSRVTLCWWCHSKRAHTRTPACLVFRCH